MREEQADRIIELLEEINEKLPAWTAYDLSDIYSEIGTVKSAMDDLKVAVDDVKDAVENINLG